MLIQLLNRLSVANVFARSDNGWRRDIKSHGFPSAVNSFHLLLFRISSAFVQIGTVRTHQKERSQAVTLHILKELS